MSITERVDLLTRANRALHQLEANKHTTLRELGTARDLVNAIANTSNAERAWAAILEIEGLVCLIYGGRPD